MNNEPLGGFEQRLLERLSVVDAARPPGAPRSRRRVRRMARPTVVFVVVTTGIAIGVAATAATALFGHRDLVVAGDDLYPGGPIFLKGAGCAPGAAVEVRIDDLPLGSAMADPSGLFLANLVLPASAGVGSHVITATCSDGGDAPLVQRLTVSVSPPRPTALLEPDFAIAGSTVTGGQFMVKGAGCQPGTRVSFAVGATSLGTGIADDSGGYTVLLSAGTLRPGEHTVAATCTGHDGATLALTTTLVIVDPADAGPTTKHT